MKLKTLATVALGAAAITLAGSPTGELGLFAAAQAQSDAVRPEVGKHLRDASTLLKGGKGKEALAKIREAEAVGGRTAAENNAIEGMRFSAAQLASDPDTMARSFDALKGAGRLQASQQLQYMEAIAGTYLRNKDNAKALSWAQRYFKEGGNSAGMKQVLTNAQYLSGDMSATIKDTLEEISADERAGRTPSMDKLNLLLSAALKKGDANAEAVATEKLLNYYPRKELWSQVLGGLQSKKGFSDRFTLDVYRLKLATGNMRDANDYSEMAQLAAQAGFPEEGKQVVDKGLAANVLGQGAEAAKAKRLSDFLGKKIAEGKAALPEAEKAANAAKDGNALVAIGMGYTFRGEAAKGVVLIEQGIAKGNLKRPDDAKLYLGMSQHAAGSTAKAQATWRTVKGTDGVADLARLWSIQSRSAKR